MTKLIYVCCGTGVATSTMIANKIKKFLENERIPFSINQYTVRDVATKCKQKKPDLIVTSSQIIGNIDEDIPVVMGRNLLTGIGKDKTFEEIKKALLE